MLYDILKHVISQNIVKSFSYKSLEQALPQKKIRTLVKAREIYDKKQKFIASYGKLSAYLAGMNKIPVLMWYPLPEVKHNLLKSVNVLPSYQERYSDKPLVIPQEVLRARNAIGGKMLYNKNENLAVVGPMSSGNVKQTKKNIYSCATPIKSRRLLEVDAQRYGVEFDADESDLGLCEKIKTKIMEKQRKERSPSEPIFLKNSPKQ